LTGGESVSSPQRSIVARRGQEGAQALAAQVARGLPEAAQGLHDRGTIAGGAAPPLRSPLGWPVVEEGDGVVPVVAGRLDEGVQDLSLLDASGSAVVGVQGLGELVLGEGNHGTGRTSQGGDKLARFSMRQRPRANSDSCEAMRPIDKMLGAFLQLGRVLITRTAFS